MTYNEYLETAKRGLIEAAAYAPNSTPFLCLLLRDHAGMPEHVRNSMRRLRLAIDAALNSPRNTDAYPHGCTSLTSSAEVRMRHPWETRPDYETNARLEWLDAQKDGA